MSSAAAAPTRWPRMIRFLARPSPIIRASRWLPPLPGIIPRRISGSPISTLSAAMRKSEASASSSPTPST